VGKGEAVIFGAKEETGTNRTGPAPPPIFVLH